MRNAGCGIDDAATPQATPTRFGRQGFRVPHSAFELYRSRRTSTAPFAWSTCVTFASRSGEHSTQMP